MKAKKSKKKNKLTKFPPRIIIKFQSSIPFPYQNDKEIQEYFIKNNIASWKKLSKIYPGITISKLFTSLTPGEIIKLVSNVNERNPNYKNPNFLTCFVIDCPYGTNAHELLSQLLKDKAVEFAYIESDPVPPPGDFMGLNPLNRDQGYLDPAPVGIDARFAWTVSGGQGEGNVKFIDIERGWVLDHEDIDDAGVSLLWGKNLEFQDHGTAVLGIILMQDNDFGGIGITPLVKANVISEITPNSRHSINNAILKAVDALDFGDILLLEHQVSDTNPADKYWPPEIKQMTFDVINLATAKGIIVIEPAGNGSNDRDPQGNNLDEFPDQNGKRIFDRESNDFKDSGAIIVSAASDSRQHRRKEDSNYGNRVDCFAWGTDVVTAGFGTVARATDSYTDNFNSTSSASAIIAGAAIAVQSIVEASGRSRLSPAQMRSILGSASGTRSSSMTNIGFMPDLKQIIDNVLSGITPS